MSKTEFMCHKNYSCKYQIFLILLTFLVYGLMTYLLNGGGVGTTKIVSFKGSLKLVSVIDGSSKACLGIAILGSSTLSLCLLCSFEE